MLACEGVVSCFWGWTLGHLVAGGVGGAPGDFVGDRFDVLWYYGLTTGEMGEHDATRPSTLFAGIGARERILASAGRGRNQVLIEGNTCTIGRPPGVCAGILVGIVHATGAPITGGIDLLPKVCPTVTIMVEQPGLEESSCVVIPDG